MIKNIKLCNEMLEHIIDLYPLLIDKKVIVFGAGKLGTSLGFILNGLKIEYSFVDNDDKKWGAFLWGKQIFSPVELLTEDRNNLVIFVASVHHDAISTQLKENGFLEYNHFYNLYNNKLLMNILAVQKSGDSSEDLVECVCCGKKVQEFLPYALRANAQCPQCGSLERHRLFWLFLKQQTDFFTADLSVLHMAPEDCLQRNFFRMKNLNYISADLNSSSAMIKMDITDILFKDNVFDVIICNHVLEHIEDDYQAMSELYRVLKPKGWAILNAPVDYQREQTYEDFSVVLPSEREQRFGQWDHVRIYGRDYIRRLRSAGFSVEEIDYSSKFPQNLIRKYGLLKTGSIYLCNKQ